MDVSLDNILQFIRNYEGDLKHHSEIIKNSPKPEVFCSEQINEIATALSKAQSEYIDVDFSQVNPYTGKRYPELDDIRRATRAALSKNTLSWTQILLATDDGQRLLLTRLLHTSGQWIGSKTRIVAPSDDPHEYDSILRHHRKEDLMALLGITAANDPADDDGERAMRTIRNKEVKGTDLDYQQKPRPKGMSTALVTKDHLEELEIELDEYPDLLRQIYKKNHIESLADLPDCEYRSTIDKIRQIKELRRTNAMETKGDS
jgi:hypothetical protein